MVVRCAKRNLSHTVEANRRATNLETSGNNGKRKELLVGEQSVERSMLHKLGAMEQVMQFVTYYTLHMLNYCILRSEQLNKGGSGSELSNLKLSVDALPPVLTSHQRNSWYTTSCFSKSCKA